MDFYQLSAKTPSGKELPMAAYKGKAILIINTATKCGLAPQFDGLEQLHQTYKDQGLVVLGFPCNQFMSQEPETNETMVESCRLNFGVTFPLTEKVKVNGADTHPIFVYLKKNTGGFLGKRIKWNFTKFLITPEGEIYKRYSPTTKPERIEKDIRMVLE